jgi:hypothetical protein
MTAYVINDMEIADPAVFAKYNVILTEGAPPG